MYVSWKEEVLSRLEIMSINEAFGRVVVKLRKARGQSQEDLAWSIESSPKYMSDVELGKRNVPLLFAKKVADAFGITLHELFKLMQEEIAGSKKYKKGERVYYRFGDEICYGKIFGYEDDCYIIETPVHGALGFIRFAEEDISKDYELLKN